MNRAIPDREGEEGEVVTIAMTDGTISKRGMTLGTELGERGIESDLDPTHPERGGATDTMADE
jgi:hypothetical protein